MTFYGKPSPWVKAAMEYARILDYLRNSELDMIRIKAEMYAKKETSDDRQQSQ